MKLLIADDEVRIREGLSQGIDWPGLGFGEVLTAENGVEALERFRTHRPELVITDIRMPGMDGLELCAKIREYSVHTKIIILSGYFEFDYAKRALQVGANDYELKPVKIKSLLRRAAELQAEYYAETSFSTVPADNGNVLIGQALSYMQRHFNKDITVKGVADYLGITPNYLSHLFNKELGVSFREHLNKIRIQEAKRLLKETNLMSYEIMEQVGFRNYKHFIQVFKKFEGVSPSDIRRS